MQEVGIIQRGPSAAAALAGGRDVQASLLQPSAGTSVNQGGVRSESRNHTGSQPAPNDLVVRDLTSLGSMAELYLDPGAVGPVDRDVQDCAAARVELLRYRVAGVFGGSLPVVLLPAVLDGFLRDLVVAGADAASEVHGPESVSDQPHEHLRALIVDWGLLA